MTARPSTTLPILAATILIPVSIALIFWWVPDDADQGFSQRIFYFHVPVALTTYACFAFAAVCAALHLTRRDPAWDLRSYVGIHVGTIFGTLVLVTGPHLGQDLVGRLVELVGSAAQRLPDPLPLLLRVLHAALLARRG